MAMKFLYLLVSEEKDIYYEQTLVSVMSLRHHNPEAFVSLIVDDRTDENLVGFRASIKDFVQEYKVVSFEKDVSNIARSRLLKTNMRNLIDGDFLYLDGDTAISAPFDDSLCGNYDVGAIADLHARENDSYHVKHKKNNANKAKMNFTLPLSELFFNGGVIYAKDNDAARVFFNKWHELYKLCNTKGIFTDQISFNESNHLLGRPIGEISGIWNCQVREAYNHLYRVKVIYPLLCDAKVIHFFGSGIDGKKEPHPLMKNDFFEKIKKNQCVDEDALQVVYNAQTSFYGAPAKLDPSKKFPLFFIYRQFPNLFKFIYTVKSLFCGIGK